MHLNYIELDDRLDAALAFERRAPAALRKDFRRRFLLGWIYHELNLEGSPLSESDLYRALRGCDGDDYCEGLLFDSIRRMKGAIDLLGDRSFRRVGLQPATLEQYHHALTGEAGDLIWRTDEGATEHYKHDVVAPEQIHEEIAALCADVERWTGMRHPIQIAIAVHYRLVKIWPFQRFSAAVARMVANEILAVHGYPPALIHAQERQRYYHSMHYDISRSHALFMDSLREQIVLRERVFAPQRVSAGEVRAYC